MKWQRRPTIFYLLSGYRRLLRTLFVDLLSLPYMWLIMPHGLVPGQFLARLHWDYTFPSPRSFSQEVFERWSRRYAGCLGYGCSSIIIVTTTPYNNSQSWVVKLLLSSLTCFDASTVGSHSRRLLPNSIA